MKTAVEKSMFWSEIRLGVRGRLVYLVNIYIYIYIFFFFFFLKRSGACCADYEKAAREPGGTPF